MRQNETLTFHAQHLTFFALRLCESRIEGLLWLGDKTGEAIFESLAVLVGGMFSEPV